MVALEVFWCIVIFECHCGLLEINHALVTRLLLNTVLVANMQNTAMGFAHRAECANHSSGPITVDPLRSVPA